MEGRAVVMFDPEQRAALVEPGIAGLVVFERQNTVAAQQDRAAIGQLHQLRFARRGLVQPFARARLPQPQRAQQRHAGGKAGADPAVIALSAAGQSASIVGVIGRGRAQDIAARFRRHDHMVIGRIMRGRLFEPLREGVPLLEVGFRRPDCPLCRLGKYC